MTPGEFGAWSLGFQKGRPIGRDELRVQKAARSAHIVSSPFREPISLCSETNGVTLLLLLWHSLGEISSRLQAHCIPVESGREDDFSPRRLCGIICYGI
jgi:hypothetical protein